jgi:hypothetical protein
MNEELGPANGGEPPWQWMQRLRCGHVTAWPCALLRVARSPGPGEPRGWITGRIDDGSPPRGCALTQRNATGRSWAQPGPPGAVSHFLQRFLFLIVVPVRAPACVCVGYTPHSQSGIDAAFSFRWPTGMY